VFDWRREVSRYENILRNEFPMECPVCDKPMETGYLTGILTKWVQKDLVKRPFVDPVLMPDMRFHRYAWAMSIMPGYNCRKCGLLAAKYNPKHRGIAVHEVEKRKKLDFCPYCNRELKRGRIYSARGTWWIERIGKWGFARGKKIMIEPLPWWRFVGVIARRCTGCGVVFCKYEDLTTRIRLKLIAFLMAIILPLLMLIFLFAE
jgi:hypothetical protein